MYEVCQKSSRTGCAVWAMSGVEINSCINIWRNIQWAYNCNFSSLKPLYTFSQARINGYLNFTRQAMTTKQRINLKFLVRLGKTPLDALGTLQEVYRDATMSRSHVFEWHKWFKEGRDDVGDDSRSGRPSTSRTAYNVECVKQMVHGDCQLTA